MCDSDDDAPPSLQSLGSQLHALNTRTGGVEQPQPIEGSGAEKTAVAEVTVASKPKAATKAATSLRKGFFDAKPKRQPRPQQRPQQTAPVDDVPYIKASKSADSALDMFNLQGNNQDAQHSQYKQKILDVMKPTQQSLETVLADPILAAGYDDPEIMKAVDEIAKDPDCFRKKYANNPKIGAFYVAMCKLVGNTLERAAEVRN